MLLETGSTLRSPGETLLFPLVDVAPEGVMSIIWNTARNSSVMIEVTEVLARFWSLFFG